MNMIVGSIFPTNPKGRARVNRYVDITYIIGIGTYSLKIGMQDLITGLVVVTEKIYDSIWLIHLMELKTNVYTFIELNLKFHWFSFIISTKLFNKIELSLSVFTRSS